jgi:hypothetical protein
MIRDMGFVYRISQFSRSDLAEQLTVARLIQWPPLNAERQRREDVPSPDPYPVA